MMFSHVVHAWFYAMVTCLMLVFAGVLLHIPVATTLFALAAICAVFWMETAQSEAQRQGDRK